MLANLLERLRRRPTASITASLALHLLVIGALLWVKPPSTMVVVKRGEPLFVELPEADELAQRGGPDRPAVAPERPKAAAAPRPAPRASERPPSVKPAPPRVEPEPPAVARATPPPAAPEAPAPPVPVPPPAPAAPAAPPVAQAPTPTEPPGESARESAHAAGPKVAAAPATRAPSPDIRSALRRSGPGAGGSGEGWAGIEGEPIPLDSKDKRYNDYLDRVRRMIKSRWSYPCVTQATGECEYKSAKLVIVFGILKDGSVPRVEVAERSAYEIYDDYAVRAIQLASPFPPVPPELLAAATQGSTGIRIVASFHYILDTSLWNVLR